MARTFTSASSQYLDTTSVPVTGPAFTFSCWFKTTLTDAVYRCLISLATATNNDDYWEFYQYANEIYCDANSTVASSFAGSASTVVADTWTHGAVVAASATSRRMYLDGAAGTVDAVSVVPATPTRFSVGRHGRQLPADYHNGSIAEVAVWNAALSGADMTALAAGDSPMSLATTPVRYWRLKDDGDFADVVSGALLTNGGSVHTADHPTVDDPPAPAGGGNTSLLLGIS